MCVTSQSLVPAGTVPARLDAVPLDGLLVVVPAVPTWQAGTMPGSAASSPGTASAVVYRERLLPSGWAWLIPPAAGVAFWFILSAVHSLTGVVTAVVATAALAALLWLTSPVVEVRAAGDQRWLHAGRARIERGYLGKAQVLDADGMRRAMGPELSTAAFVCQRPWVGTAVRVQVVDDADPTPYWLVSTRAPHRLLEALALDVAG